eukprot:CAMPEP_0194354726 /NCGR_PEP_ID=MMETSP0174-20130528/2783_1 /TAXON_ID=216777 /ORGANISM="Proboscia alata, Strain PI-D3" /LENGTH=554 /DNA_ID=CAMNT_0039123739 /DNA_START=179 /DNA_END=1843 /DNA_ORIENTATION=-
MTKEKNNKFSQTRLAGSLMQPLSLRTVDRSTSGGPNLAQNEHAIRVRKQKPSMMRTPKKSNFRVKTADKSRRLHPHNASGSMRIRQAQSGIHVGNTIPAEQDPTSNTTLDNQPLRNKIMRKSSHPAPLPIKEQHCVEQYSKEQYDNKEQRVKELPVKKLPAKKLIVKKMPVKEQYGKEKHVHVQKHTPESNFRVKRADESRRMHPHNAAASIRVRKTQSNIPVGNTIPTKYDPSLNTTWDDEPLENTIMRKSLDPAAVTVKEQKHVHVQKYTPSMAQSEHGITRHSLAPTDSILLPVKEQYGKEKYAREQQVHVQKHTPETNFRVKTADESRRLHPHDAAASMRVRQTQSSIHVGNTIPKKYEPSSNTTWDDEPLKNTIIRKSSDPAALMIKEQKFQKYTPSMAQSEHGITRRFSAPTDSILRVKTLSESQRVRHTRCHLSPRETKSSLNFDKITVVEYDRKIGDHPGARGPPISMGRNPKAETDICLDKYENTMKTNRSRREMFLTPVQREAELRRAGYSRGQIFEATQGVKDIQRMRKQTAKHLKEQDAVRR